jgi:hypothetical protein
MSRSRDIRNEEFYAMKREERRSDRSRRREFVEGEPKLDEKLQLRRPDVGRSLWTETTSDDDE